MKRYLQRAVGKIVGMALTAAKLLQRLDLISDQLAIAPRHPVDKGTQLLLTFQYQNMARTGIPLPALRDVGFRAFSQNDEDGILLYIFSLIGTTNQTAVEICAGSGVECNTANLIVNHAWRGLLFDGSAANVAVGREFYAKHPNTLVRPPTVVEAWITPENINELITTNGFEGTIDLLSLDMDGMDYWVLQAIESIRPRVIVLEHNSPWGAARAVTVPYQRDFTATFVDGAPEYCGASLSAFAKLLEARGYRLIGLEALGINAFFIQDGLGEELLPKVTVDSCFSDSILTAAARAKHEAYLARLSTREYVEV